MSGFGPQSNLAAIREPYELLDNPARLHDYIVAMKRASRPSLNLGSTITQIEVNNSTGDDITGDGSVSAPYETAERALMDVHENNGALIVINLANTGTKYTISSTISNYNNVYILGDYTVSETRNITGVTYSNAAQGQLFTVDGATLTDDWVGRVLLIQGQLGNTEAIVVSRVDGNDIYGVMVKASYVGFTDQQRTMTATGTVQRLSMPELELGSNLWNNLATFFVGFCRVTGSEQFMSMVNNVSFVKCEMEVDAITGSKGSLVVLYQCALLMNGTSRTGFFGATENGLVRLANGCVYTGLQADRSTPATYRNFGAQIDGTMQLWGGAILRDLDSEGIFCRGGRIDELTNTYSDGMRIWFEDIDSGSLCAAGFVFDDPPGFTSFADSLSQGSKGYIPDCNGEVSSDYFVTGQGGSDVTIRSGCTVDTNTVENAVSADGGTTAGARAADGTVIRGGTPDASASVNFTLSVTSATSSPDLSTYGTIEVNYAGAVTINLPDATTLQAGTTVVIFDKSGAAATNNITIDPNGSQTINGASTAIINQNYGSTRIQTDGANWFIIA